MPRRFVVTASILCAVVSLITCRGAGPTIPRTLDPALVGEWQAQHGLPKPTSFAEYEFCFRVDGTGYITDLISGEKVVQPEEFHWGTEDGVLYLQFPSSGETTRTYFVEDQPIDVLCLDEGTLDECSYDEIPDI